MQVFNVVHAHVYMVMGIQLLCLWLKDDQRYVCRALPPYTHPAPYLLFDIDFSN